MSKRKAKKPSLKKQIREQIACASKRSTGKIKKKRADSRSKIKLEHSSSLTSWNSLKDSLPEQLLENIKPRSSSYNFLESSINEPSEKQTTVKTNKRVLSFECQRFSDVLNDSRFRRHGIDAVLHHVKNNIVSVLDVNEKDSYLADSI